MVSRVLSDYQRLKNDESDDSLFYSQPRFVHHLDEGFRSSLTMLYRERIPQESILLDLMSSWVSHLPEDLKYKRVIGHGLNQTELERNKRLNTFWIQDLNKDWRLPIDDCSIDYCLMVAAWQYLKYPEEISSEIIRSLSPNGKIIVSFSNRAFWDKTPNIWRNGTDDEHVQYVKSILYSQGFTDIEVVMQKGESKGIYKRLGVTGDPFFSVIAKK